MIPSRSHLLAAAAALTLTAAAPPAFCDPATPITLAQPPAGKGQVVFYRKPLFSLVPFNWIAREGKAEICEMQAGAYCVAIVDPGTHTYEVHSEAKNDLTLEVDAGETYYVLGGISMGLIVNHPTIAPAQKIEFDAISAKLKSLPPFPAASGQQQGGDALAAPAATATSAPAPSTAPTTPAPAPSAAPAAPSQ